MPSDCGTFCRSTCKPLCSRRRSPPRTECPTATAGSFCGNSSSRPLLPLAHPLGNHHRSLANRAGSTPCRRCTPTKGDPPAGAGAAHREIPRTGKERERRIFASPISIQEEGRRRRLRVCRVAGAPQNSAKSLSQSRTIPAVTRSDGSDRSQAGVPLRAPREACGGGPPDGNSAPSCRYMPRRGRRHLGVGSDLKVVRSTRRR